MRNILNYETKREFLADGNILPDTYWLRKDASYKENYIPTREDSSQKYGPFNSKGMVTSVFPGVAYIQECGMTIYNNTKFPLIDLTTKEFGTDYRWEDFGITEDIYQAYMNEINNMNPLESLNIKFPDNTVARYIGKVSVGDVYIVIYDTEDRYSFRIYSNGVVEYTINVG